MNILYASHVPGIQVVYAFPLKFSGDTDMAANPAIHNSQSDVEIPHNLKKKSEDRLHDPAL